MNANVNVRDDTGFTPLHYAAFIGNLIIHHRWKFLTSSFNSNSISAFADNSQMIDTLVGLHAIVNAESDGGVTPLHIAAFEGKSITHLDWNFPILFKFFFLFFSFSFLGKVNAVRALLRHHASLDATPAGTARDLATAKGNHTTLYDM